jgi:hypothetical protein
MKLQLRWLVAAGLVVCAIAMTTPSLAASPLQAAPYAVRVAPNVPGDLPFPPNWPGLAPDLPFPPNWPG